MDMPPVPPLPSGENSPDYYERMFGERVRKVVKPGGRYPTSGAKHWNGGTGVGIVAVVLVLALRIALGSFNHSRSYEPPPPMPFKHGLQVLPPMMERPNLDPHVWPLPNQIPVLERPNLLIQEDDVPLLGGLCYRIHHESRQGAPTPGKCICAHLANPALNLIRRAAMGAPITNAEGGELIAALNEMLQNKVIYDQASFAKVHLPDKEVQISRKFDKGSRFKPGQLLQVNRVLLQAAYPNQILPASRTDALRSEAMRKFWLAKATRDLDDARREFEGK
jgi:hypothetical protein